MDQLDASPQPPPTVPATVSTHGDGWVAVVPDAATIRIGVTVTKPDLPAARAEAAQLAGAIIASAKKADIPAKDMQTTSYRIQAVYDTRPKAKAAIRGYEVSNTVTITVRDLNHLPAVLDAAIASGANQVQGPDFFMQRPEVAEDEARRLAMASARRRAEVLAATEGASLGRVRSIADGVSRGISPRMAFRAAESLDAGPATPIEAGTERISASVDVTWDLQEATPDKNSD
jgi:uncharacterized protein YggE